MEVNINELKIEKSKSKSLEKQEELAMHQKSLRGILWLVLVCYTIMILAAITGINIISPFWWIGIPIGLMLTGTIAFFVKKESQGSVYQGLAIILFMIAIFAPEVVSSDVKPIFNGGLWGLIIWYGFLEYKQGTYKKFIRDWKMARTAPQTEES